MYVDKKISFQWKEMATIKFTFSGSVQV